MQVIGVEIIDALKIAMKSRGVTYKHVAEKLGVSEKTIKRLFKDKDCQLSRLNEICDAIGLSIYDLIEFAKRHTEPRVRLDDGQEVFLKDNRLHFYFLFFLTVGYTPVQIQKEYELSDLSVFKYLRDLDKQGFIELGESNRYRLLIEGKLLMRLHGPLHETLKDVNEIFLRYVLDRDNESKSAFESSFRYMTLENMGEMMREYESVTQKYRKVAHQDEAVLPREQLFPVKWSTLISQYNICGIWPLKEHPEEQTGTTVIRRSGDFKRNSFKF
tara:strand:+ start:259 stop:1074 length:816 start_codon:yes stop_codon:yes gene_type:complete